MTLNSALNGVIAGLSVASTQISVASRNIANQSNPYASRKIANVVTVNGLATVTSISRSSNAALTASLLTANSNQAQQSAISDALTQLQSTLGTSSSDAASPTALLGQLTDALQNYADAPQNTASAQAAVTAASNLTSGLNSASATVQNVREQADAGIASSVGTINSVLNQFAQVNQAIVNGTQSGADVTDALDRRDGLLQQLSSQIGITTVTGANNDVEVFTDSGLTLFDQTAMPVTFTPTPAFSAPTQGNAVYVDGVPVTVKGSPFSIQSGSLSGLVSIRDNIAPTYQSQLDQIAGGLITDFQETDQSASPTQPPQAGLLTNGGSLTVPPAGTVTPGLAATIQVAAAVNPTTGNPALLRDGGISSNGAAPYVYNPVPGQTGYTARLNQLISNLSQPLAFDPSAGAGSQASVTDYASSSASWLGAQVSQASTAASYSAAVQNTASTALSNATGVNLDNELSNMLALEQSYQASAKLMNTVNTLYSSLFAAV
ncbi:MAG: flagellar hook-associated protein FlgK [Rhodomicrobium sp.]